MRTTIPSNHVEALSASWLRTSGTQDFERIADERINKVHSLFAKMKMTISKCLIKYICRSNGVVEHEIHKRNPYKICCINNTSRAIALVGSVALTAITCTTYVCCECYCQHQDRLVIREREEADRIAARTASLVPSSYRGRSSTAPLAFLSPRDENTPRRLNME